MFTTRQVACVSFLLALGIAVSACDDQHRAPIKPETSVRGAKATTAAPAKTAAKTPGATAAKVTGNETAAKAATAVKDVADPSATAASSADEDSRSRSESTSATEGKKNRSDAADEPSSAVASSRDPQVKLLAAGKQPHKKLRLSIKVGQQETMTMTMSSEMAMRIGDRSIPKTKLPSTVLKMALKVANRTPAGDHRYTYELVNVGVLKEPGMQPEVVNAVKAALKGVQGLSGHAVVSDRGFTRDASVNIPKGASPQVRQMIQGMQQAMKQIAVPLPEEPVGVGARWQFSTPMTANGMRVFQTTTVELVDLKNEILTLKTKIKQKAKPQTVSPPGMPAGASIDLVSLKSRGSGQVEMALSRLVPVKGTSTAQVDMKAKMTKPEPTPMRMKMGMKIVVTGS